MLAASVSERSVYRALRDLENVGLITRERDGPAFTDRLLTIHLNKLPDGVDETAPVGGFDVPEAVTA